MSGFLLLLCINLEFLQEFVSLSKVVERSSFTLSPIIEEFYMANFEFEGFVAFLVCTSIVIAASTNTSDTNRAPTGTGIHSTLKSVIQTKLISFWIHRNRLSRKRSRTRMWM